MGQIVLLWLSHFDAHAHLNTSTYHQLLRFPPVSSSAWDGAALAPSLMHTHSQTHLICRHKPKSFMAQNPQVVSISVSVSLGRCGSGSVTSMRTRTASSTRNDRWPSVDCTDCSFSFTTHWDPGDGREGLGLPGLALALSCLSLGFNRTGPSMPYLRRTKQRGKSTRNGETGETSCEASLVHQSLEPMQWKEEWACQALLWN